MLAPVIAIVATAGLAAQGIVTRLDSPTRSTQSTAPTRGAATAADAQSPLPWTVERPGVTAGASGVPSHSHGPGDPAALDPRVEAEIDARIDARIEARIEELASASGDVPSSGLTEGADPADASHEPVVGPAGAPLMFDVMLLTVGLGIGTMVGAMAVVYRRTARRVAADAKRIRALETELRALRQSEERFRSLVLNTSDVVTIIDADAKIEYQSPSAERIWGYSVEALQQRCLFSLVHPEDLEVTKSLLAQARVRPRLSLAAETRLRLADDTWCYFDAVATNLARDRRVGGTVVTFRDITERKHFEQALSYQAFHDTLTRLPNRTLFRDRLERAQARATRHETSLAVMFLDLDNFKVVNDSLGHLVGDQLLVAITGRVQACLRREDTLARLGGDEFAVLIEEVASVDEARRLAERIQESLRSPFTVNGHEMFASMSIGVVMDSVGNRSPDDLLRDADLAMYRAKSNGKACHEVFDETLDASVSERLALETGLRRAVERGELRIHYQPIVALSSGRIVGFEALVRWEHPQRGLVGPIDFIPLAEETGLILPIGTWVLEEACRQVHWWSQMHEPQQPLMVSVNVSARQFQSPDFVKVVSGVLERTGIDPRCLKLELTESLMIENGDRAMERLRELDGLSIQLAVDDFGTGYSALAYLRRLPISVLKVDRSFVSHLGMDPQDDAIVRSIVTLARDLGMAVVAEGIETEAQLDFMRALQCDYGQGFLFSRPVPGAVAEALLATQATESAPLAIGPMLGGLSRAG